MQVDLTKSDVELGLAITKHCSNIGSVRSVRIHRRPKPFALIEMSTHGATLQLAAQYKRSAFGSCVLVYLTPESPER